VDRLIYTAASGARQILERQAVMANDLANAATVGFKGQMSMFRAVPVNGAGWPTRAVTAETTPAPDLASGSSMRTGRALDVAIDGPGWLAVQAPGGEAYTRAGNLQADATGVLRSDGHPVLGTGGQPIVLPLEAKVTIAHDGTISALGAGDQPDTLSEIGQLKLVDPPTAQLTRGGDGLFRRTGAPDRPFAESDTVRVDSGTLEASNVNPTDAMVGMIDDARRFAMQMKMISMTNDNARSANQLMSLR
jgi:flagellar basal-body rod protein FlgF